MRSNDHSFRLKHKPKHLVSWWIFHPRKKIKSTQKKIWRFQFFFLLCWGFVALICRFSTILFGAFWIKTLAFRWMCELRHILTWNNWRHFFVSLPNEICAHLRNKKKQSAASVWYSLDGRLHSFNSGTLRTTNNFQSFNIWIRWHDM